MRLIVRAKRLRENDIFILSHQKCTVVQVLRNQYAKGGQTIIHFTTDSTDDVVNALTLKDDFPIEIKK